MYRSIFPFLLVTLAVAAPTYPDLDLFPKCKATNDPVYYAAQHLKGNPNGLKYCLEKILKVTPITRTVVIGATKTAMTTNTAENLVIVTGGELGGTVTVTAAPVSVSETETITQTTTTSSDVCPAPTVAPVKRFLKGNHGDCPNAPILGFACELLSYACNCLTIPAPTVTSTVTSTNAITATVTQTIDVTTAIPTIVTETPTITGTETVTSTVTTCVAPARPTANTCSPATTCGNVNFCTGSDTCICLMGSAGISACGNIALDQGCGAQQPCTVDTDCGPTDICITACCDTKICYATSGCANLVAPSRLFRKEAQAGGQRELPPSFRPQGDQGI
ncbi:hypothetical protein HBH70_044210 [Parastagonospora nodorum]|nr:hypothetical protein HBH51_201660 [Parastagonospora nodorum]KAH3984953.1 hypothetical protein HBH52_050220 [Parastagonospora nodorum]KAH4109144.1 hypothetical protein HBH46_039760 [Parastagonospora nodorum]KAH4231847.1 hypothetical protein HBI06_072650 [Parastagonospora nodorum]KAH4245713.1 hypothetical protein HBI05_055860 [Parastagonospora nodorum]